MLLHVNYPISDLTLTEERWISRFSQTIFSEIGRVVAHRDMVGVPCDTRWFTLEHCGFGEISFSSERHVQHDHGQYFLHLNSFSNNLCSNIDIRRSFLYWRPKPRSEIAKARPYDLYDMRGAHRDRVWFAYTGAPLKFLEGEPYSYSQTFDIPNALLLLYVVANMDPRAIDTRHHFTIPIGSAQGVLKSGWERWNILLLREGKQREVKMIVEERVKEQEGDMLIPCAIRMGKIELSCDELLRLRPGTALSTELPPTFSVLLEVQGVPFALAEASFNPQMELQCLIKKML